MDEEPGDWNAARSMHRAGCGRISLAHCRGLDPSTSRGESGGGRALRSRSMAADRDLLFGLLALQNGLADQAGLVAAFQAWSRDKRRPLADHMQGLGLIDAATNMSRARRTSPQVWHRTLSL